MRFLVFMCGSSVVALLIGVGLTVWSYVQGPELAYETTVPLFFGTVLVTIVASWGHRATEIRPAIPRWQRIMGSAPRWSLVVLAVTGAHLLLMGGWKLLSIRHRTPIEELDPGVVLATQNLCVHILAWAVVLAFSARRSHWSQVDLDEDLDLE